MSDYPLLALGTPKVGPIPPADRPSFQPPPAGPGSERQGARLGPRFENLASTLRATSARTSDQRAEDSDPELVVVFELAGTVGEFQKAISLVDGLEFLAEVAAESVAADADFANVKDGQPLTTPVGRSIYFAMTNSAGIDELIRLFNGWREDESKKLPHGLGKFKQVFSQLRDIRRWGPRDRVEESGLLIQWAEDLAVMGSHGAPKPVEIELWWRDAPEKRASEMRNLREMVESTGGHVRAVAEVEDIGYHAILAEIPFAAVEQVLEGGANTIEILRADSVMFVSPYAPMGTSAPVSSADASVSSVQQRPKPTGQPRVALFDGLPAANHSLLQDRMVVDDPDNLDSRYPGPARVHGSAVASTIIHGDLSASHYSLTTPLYARPVLVPHEVLRGAEVPVPGVLFPDLIHRSIRRLFERDGAGEASAPSVRVINLSIGDRSRPFVRSLSPLARIVDWAAHTYNVVIVVSSGNHPTDSISIDYDDSASINELQERIQRAVAEQARLRGVLPPAEAVNALSVGAVHRDGAGDGLVPSNLLDPTLEGHPSIYSATGPGFRRSVKPEILAPGGRQWLVRPPEGSSRMPLVAAPHSTKGPGVLVAFPGTPNPAGGLAFVAGTSYAAGLVTRAVDRVLQELEEHAIADGTGAAIDPQFHPVLARALIAHNATWADLREKIQTSLPSVGARILRRDTSHLLGYGSVDAARLLSGAPNRATAIAGANIEPGQRHVYIFPKPESMRSRAEWHRLTLTVAYATPCRSAVRAYRGVRIYLEKLDDSDVGGRRIEVDPDMAVKGTCQSEVYEGRRAMTFTGMDNFAVAVECKPDAIPGPGPVRYGLAATFETRTETSTTIYSEIQQRLEVKTEPRVTVTTASPRSR